MFICGVRGSTPSPGPQFVRYGGNTSCIALAQNGQAPRLVLDAGTGLQRLTPLLDGRPFRGSILLGHLHWDHTHGLPFFSAGDRPDAEVTLVMPAQGDPANVLARVMSPPHFPIKPAELRGRWRFLGIQEGPPAVDYAVGLAEAAGVKRLLLFHHDPARTDDQIDAIVAAHRGNAIPVEAAAEGTVIDHG